MVIPSRKRIGPSRQRRNDKRNEEMRAGKAIDPNWSRKTHGKVANTTAAATESSPHPPESKLSDVKDSKDVSAMPDFIISSAIKATDETKSKNLPTENSVFPASSYPLTNGSISVSIWKFIKFKQLEEVFQDLDELLKLEGNQDLLKLEGLLKEYKAFKRPSVVSRLKLSNSFKHVYPCLDKLILESCKLSLKRCHIYLGRRTLNAEDTREEIDFEELVQFCKNFLKLREEMKKGYNQFSLDIQNLGTLFRDVEEKKLVGTIPDIDASSDMFLQLLARIDPQDLEKKMVDLAKYLSSKVGSFISTVDEAKVIVESLPSQPNHNRESSSKVKEEEAVQTTSEDNSAIDRRVMYEQEGKEFLEMCLTTEAESVSPTYNPESESEMSKETESQGSFEKESRDATVVVFEKKLAAPSLSEEHHEDALIPLASSSPKECLLKVCSARRERSVQSGRYEISTVNEMLEIEFGKNASEMITKGLSYFDDGEGFIPASTTENVLLKYSYLFSIQ